MDRRDGRGQVGTVIGQFRRVGDDLGFSRWCVLTITGAGLWTMSTLAAFSAEVLPYGATLKIRYGQSAALNDVRNMPVQISTVTSDLEILMKKVSRSRSRRWPLGDAGNHGSRRTGDARYCPSGPGQVASVLDAVFTAVRVQQAASEPGLRRLNQALGERRHDDPVLVRPSGGGTRRSSDGQVGRVGTDRAGRQCNG